MHERGSHDALGSGEREILALWDQGMSRQQIQRATGYHRNRIRDALSLNEDGEHRKHRAATQTASAALSAAWHRAALEHRARTEAQHG